MASTQIDGGKQVRAGTLTNAEISASAGIALTKLSNTVIRADGATAFTADQPMGGFKLTGLGTPTATTDAATKAYVDGGIRIVTAIYTTSTTGTTVIPQDDTIPQNTEGDEYMSLSITPQLSTNRLIIEVDIMLSNNAATANLAALFQNTTANALAAASVFQSTSTGLSMVRVVHEMAAGTTSATTFKVRGGAAGAGTTTFNGAGAARRFGAITKSMIKITEIKG